MNKYTLILIILCCICGMTGIYILRSNPTPILVFSVMAVCLTAIGFICAGLLRTRK